MLVKPTLHDGLLQTRIDLSLHTAPIEGGHVDLVIEVTKIVLLLLASLEQ